MSEAADLFREKLNKMADLGVIYAAYWDMINEASGRLLLRSGLNPRGRKPILEEYPADRCRKMFEYDLWRLSQAETGNVRDTVLLQVARRTGGFVAEDILEKKAAMEALAGSYGSATLTDDAMAMFGKAIGQPGIAYFEIRGDAETGKPVNRLG